jgi:hypothetical protein
MTCTEACRKAMPGTCCCSCSGAHHGEAAPIQQKRLALEAVARMIGEGTVTIPDAAIDPAQLTSDASVALIYAIQPHVEVHAETCACEVCRSESPRQPHERTVEGRTVHLAPGYRYTLDSEDGEPIWIASHNGRRASAVDPDVAARKALGA